MKSLFYLLSVLAIGAAAYFGWTAKEKYTLKLDERNDFRDRNEQLTKSISKQEKAKQQSSDARALALDEESEKRLSFEKAVAKEKEIRSALDEHTAQLEEVTAEEETVDAGIQKVKDLFPGIGLDEVAEKISSMKEKEKMLSSELEDLELFKTKLTDEVAKNGSEIERVSGKVAQTINNIKGNTFQATVTAVDNRWDFVIIGAGENSGLTADTKLLVVRGGKLVGKLSIHQLEANRAVADISPGSVKVGSSLRRGDQVILEKVRSN